MGGVREKRGWQEGSGGRALTVARRGAVRLVRRWGSGGMSAATASTQSWRGATCGVYYLGVRYPQELHHSSGDQHCPRELHWMGS